MRQPLQFWFLIGYRPIVHCTLYTVHYTLYPVWHVACAIASGWFLRPLGHFPRWDIVERPENQWFLVEGSEPTANLRRSIYICSLRTAAGDGGATGKGVRLTGPGPWGTVGTKDGADAEPTHRHQWQRHEEIRIQYCRLATLSAAKKLCCEFQILQLELSKQKYWHTTT